MIKYFLGFILITMISMLYDRYTKKQEKYLQRNGYNLVSKYLLHEIPSDGRDIIWIHIDESINARKWIHWGSRNTTSVNQPFIHLTLQSIIEKAHGDFKVCLVDDDSFSKLLPDFSVQLSAIPDPSKLYIRKIAMLQLLHHYGGIIIPMSYIACKPIYMLYNALRTSEVFVCKTPQPQVNCMQEQCFADISFMGSKKQSTILKEIIERLQHVYSNDFTEEKSILHKETEVLEPYLSSNAITVISAQTIGCEDKHGNIITLDTLFSETPIEYAEYMNGVLIPSKEIVSTSKYNWFSVSSIENIYEMKNNMGNLFRPKE